MLFERKIYISPTFLKETKVRNSRDSRIYYFPCWFICSPYLLVFSWNDKLNIIYIILSCNAIENILLLFGTTETTDWLIYVQMLRYLCCSEWMGGSECKSMAVVLVSLSVCIYVYMVVGVSSVSWNKLVCRRCNAFRKLFRLNEVWKWSFAVELF